MDSTQPSAFDGLRVLDLTGPGGSYAGKLLADLGANVLKIEPPGGDLGRRLPPFDRVSGESLHWLYHNSSKRTLTLDLQSPDGRARFRELALLADILLDTALPEALDGLDFDELRTENPGLIWASLTPFGLTGPRRDWQATDLIASAMGGLLYLAGMPERPPSWPGGEQSYLLGAVALACGVGTALLAREQTGVGQRVDVSLQEATAVATENAIGFWTFLRQIRRRTGAHSFGRATILARCRDGWVVGHIGGRWDALLDWMSEHEVDVAEYRTDNWRQAAYRAAHMDDFEPTLFAFLADLPKEQIYREGQARRIIFAPVRTPAEVLDDPQLAERDFWVDLPLGDRTIRAPGAPYRLSRTPWGGEKGKRGRGKEGWSVEPEPRPSSPFPPLPFSPLRRLRVVDFGNQVVVPLVSKMLAAHGAEVIKIEARDRGGMRYTLLPKPPGRETVNTNWLFINVNTDKRSVTVDMGRPEGRELVRRLITTADIVMDNFGVDPLPKWGMSAEELLRLRPDLIILRCSVMGRTGSRSNYIGLGNSILATSGITAITGFDGDPPVGTCTAHPDYSSNAHHALFALLAALYHRNRTGEGQLIDLSQTESTVCFAGPAILDVTANGHVQGPSNNRHPALAPHGVYRCQGDDRWIAIACPDEAWPALAGLIDPALAADPRFGTLADRKQHEDALDAIIARWCQGQDPFALMARLQAAGVPAGVAQTARDLLETDEHLAARRFFTTIDHPEAGETIVMTPHFRLGDTLGVVSRPSPLLGADNDWLAEELLGLSEEDVAATYVAGVFG